MCRNQTGRSGRLGDTPGPAAPQVRLRSSGKHHPLGQGKVARHRASESFDLATHPAWPPCRPADRGGPCQPLQPEGQKAAQGIWMRACTALARPRLPRRQTSTPRRSPSAGYRLHLGHHTNDSQLAIPPVSPPGAPAPPCAVIRRVLKTRKQHLDLSPPWAVSRDSAAAQA